MFLETAALLVGGSIALFAGADFMIRGSSTLALRLGISPLVVGLTVVAFATSSPELLVSINAAISGNPGITLGNVIGSNICNIGLILGVSAIITPLTVKLQVVRREIPVMIAANILLFVFLLEGSVSRIEGFIMLTGMIVYIILSYKTAHHSNAVQSKETFHNSLNRKQTKLWLSILLIIVGLALLAGGSELFVKGSVQFAKALGVSDVVIGLTVVAFGTSIPELITSIVAAFKNQNDLAFGNIIGSCIFNILSIIGISSIIVPLQSSDIKLIDLCVMLGFSFLILLLSTTGFVIKRWEGLLLLSTYLFYTVFVVIIPSLP